MATVCDRAGTPPTPCAATVTGVVRLTDGPRPTGVAAEASDRRRADLGFVLPSAGLSLTPRHRHRGAIAAGASQVAIEGTVPRRPLRRAGYRRQRLLALPSITSPELVVDLDSRRARRRALEHRLAGATRLRRARARAGLVLIRHAPHRWVDRMLVTVASREPSVPFPLQAAAVFGVPRAPTWHLLLGRGDDLQRMVFLVTGSDDRDGRGWAVKVARVPGSADSFARDEQGLALIAAAGGPVAERAPRLLGRGEVEGFAYSVETAAPGHRLAEVLRRRGRAAEPQLEAVAAWIVSLALTTAGPPRAWTDEAIPAELRSRLSAVAPVLQHNDLGTWNILSHSSGFTVVDWESARPEGLPLWDLLYFLADATAQMADEAAPGRWAPHAVALFRGESPLSPLAFTWIRRAAAATAVPVEAVGTIATLGWLHHAQSSEARASRLRATGSTATARPTEVAQLADLWTSDPALGPDWAAWNRDGPR